MVTTPNFDLDIDTTLGGNNASDYIIPSQKAIKSYVDNSTGSTVDQTYDGTSANAQSGIAIEGELTNNYVKTNVDDCYITNSSSDISCYYSSNPITSGLYINTSGSGLIYRDGTSDNGIHVGEYNIDLTYYSSYGVWLKSCGSSTHVSLTDVNGDLGVNGNVVATRQWVGNQGYLTSIPIGYIQNTATGTGALTINGTASASSYAVNIGNETVANANYATAIGYKAKASASSSTAVGRVSTASGSYSLALGYGATVSGGKSIQLGYGTNSTATTLSVGFQGVDNYELLDGTTGLIPDARISSNIARTSDIPSLSNYVDLTSTQNISGNKTFNNSSDLSFKNLASIQCGSGCGVHDITDFWFRGQSTYWNYPRSIVNDDNGIVITKKGITTKTDFTIDSNKIYDGTTGLIPYQRLNGVTDNNSGSLKFWSGTQAEYDAIATKDSNTIYNVEDTTSPIISILDSLYPIGAIYIGTMSTCPLQTLGIGTWQLVAQDRVLQGAGSRGAVGTTINESLPSLYMVNTGVLTAGYGLTKTSGYQDRVMVTSASGQSHYQQPSVYREGAPVQPDGYLVNIWERIS